MKFAAENIDEQYVALSREQVARALGVSVDTLDSLHAAEKARRAFAHRREDGLTRHRNSNAGNSSVQPKRCMNARQKWRGLRSGGRKRSPRDR